MKYYIINISKKEFDNMFENIIAMRPVEEMLRYYFHADYIVIYNDSFFEMSDIEIFYTYYKGGWSDSEDFIIINEKVDFVREYKVLCRDGYYEIISKEDFNKHE